LTFHDLRHSAATWLLEADVDLGVIEKLLGHRLHGMGEGYIHNWEHRLRDAVTRLERSCSKHSDRLKHMKWQAWQLWAVNGQL